jgi:phage I-like protein
MTGSAPLQAFVATEAAALAAAVEVVGADGAVKTDFLVLPYGDPIEARDGRKWILRAGDHAARVLAATRATLGGTAMMIDYDHQAAYAADGVGNRAEAAGWVSDIRAEADGIHVTVDWTDDARAALAARKYRYISPDFRFSKASGEVTRVIRAGLTNSPALDLPALAHVRGATPGEVPDMKTLTLASTALTALAAAFAVKPDELDEAKVLACVADLVKARDGNAAALASLRTELKLDADADEAAVLAAVQSVAKAGAPDPSKFVPKAGYDELAARLSAIEEARVLASVDQAVADGKIAPSMKQWAIDLGKKDEPALAAYIAGSVPFAGAATIKGEPKIEKGKLSAEEKAICTMMGVSDADFLKTRDEESV